MKRASTFVLVLALTAAGCDNDDSPTGPSNNPSNIILTSALTPANEVPPVTNADATASGTVTVTLTITQDSSRNITAATAGFQVTMTGFPAGTTLTGAHIHSGAAGVVAPVVVNTGITSGQIVLDTGAGSFSRTGITVAPELAQAILVNPAGYYFNVHTTLNPGGAIRGQLRLQ